jgi:hypothetical protein
MWSKLNKAERRRLAKINGLTEFQLSTRFLIDWWLLRGK